MLEPSRDARIVQRGLDEALACRDMLAAAPSKPSRIARLDASLGALARRVAPRQPGSAPRAPGTAHHRFGTGWRNRDTALGLAPPLDKRQLDMRQNGEPR